MAEVMGEVMVGMKVQESETINEYI